MSSSKPVVEQTALRIIRNEALFCKNCLSSGAGPTESSVYCFLTQTTEIRGKEQFCAQGTWVINGEVVDFKTGFQKIYNKDKSIGSGKELVI